MESPRTKRQKVNVACDTCRSRKIKCDGRQPICQPCQIRAGSGARCSWKPRLERISTERTRWASMPPQYLQQGTTSHHLVDGHNSNATHQASSSQTTSAPRESPSYTNQPIFNVTSFSQISEPSSQPNTQTMNTVDGCVSRVRQRQDPVPRADELSPSEHSVHAIIGATLDEDSREGFFGSSSAGTFMQNVKKMVQQKVGGVSGQPSSQHLQTQNLPASGHNTIQQKPVDYVLPSRRKADVLMSIYWRYVHVLYPYLDKAQMQEDYETIWKADSSIFEERSYMCLINIVFALCSQLDESTPIEERRQSAHVFYLRARELLDIVETGTVRSVQSFLLLAQYFQSTNEPHPCWIFTGLAVRTAQSLGLHLAETSERVTDIRTRELLRKVWHGCILMDRVVSMTYGRPCMIGPAAAGAVPLPLPLDEEYLVPESLQGQPVRSQQTFAVEFYVLSLKLYEILHDIIFNFYSVNFQPCQPMNGDKYFGPLDQGQHLVFGIEGRLSRWKKSVPERLRVATRSNPQRDGTGATLHRQAVILQQRQLHIRLLLLRPVLSKFITSEFHDGNRSVPLENLLSHRIFLQCAIVCVKVALEAIDTIYKERGSRAGETGSCAAWWYNVLYLYTSATVLIAARLAPAILADVSEESILDGWHRAMEVLEGYSPVGASIQRLTTTLRLLFKAVPEQYSRFKETPQQTQGDVSTITQDTGQRTVLLPYWRTQDPVTSFSTPLDDLTRGPQDDNDALPNDSLLDFDTVFDPKDLSWLMTIPLDS